MCASQKVLTLNMTPPPNRNSIIRLTLIINLYNPTYLKPKLPLAKVAFPITAAVQQMAHAPADLLTQIS